MWLIDGYTILRPAENASAGSFLRHETSAFQLLCQVNERRQQVKSRVTPCGKTPDKSDRTALTFQRPGFCEETGAAAAKDELILLGRFLNVASLSWKLTQSVASRGVAV